MSRAVKYDFKNPEVRVNKNSSVPAVWNSGVLLAKS